MKEPCIVCGLARHHLKTLEESFPQKTVITSEGEIVVGTPLQVTVSSASPSAWELHASELEAQSRDIVAHRCLLCDEIRPTAHLQINLHRPVCIHCIRRMMARQPETQAPK